MTSRHKAVVLGLLAAAGLASVMIAAGARWRSAAHSDRERGVPDAGALAPKVDTGGQDAVERRRSSEGETRREEPRPEGVSLNDGWVERLRATIPTLPPGDLTARRIATGRDRPWEITQVLRGFNLPHLDEPPFVVEWMFGIRDVPWLTELRAHLNGEHADAVRDLEPTNWEGRDRVLQELLPQYQRILVDVAQARWQVDPELGAFLADSRLLKDIPGDSNQHRWLRAMLDEIGPSMLWVHQEWARGRAFPLEYLAATDIPLLVELGRDGLAAVAHTKIGTTAEEISRLVRPHAERFYYGIVKQRMPE